MSRSDQRKHQPISDRRYVPPFKKAAGRSIQEIIDDGEGSYLVWLTENTDFELDHILLDEAEAGPKHTFSDYADRLMDIHLARGGD